MYIYKHKYIYIYKAIICPWGYKTFFMLNSAEHEIFHANLTLLITANSFLLNIVENKHFFANNYYWHFHIY